MCKMDELSGYGYTTAQVELRKWISVRPWRAPGQIVTASPTDAEMAASKVAASKMAASEMADSSMADMNMDDSTMAVSTMAVSTMAESWPADLTGLWKVRPPPPGDVASYLTISRASVLGISHQHKSHPTLPLPRE